jgi:hypothetical protein
MMILRWLPANQAWVFMFGDAPTRLDGEGLFYSTRKEAEEAAKRHGLKLEKRHGLWHVESAE